jgi:virginiamycin B lyase
MNMNKSYLTLIVGIAAAYLAFTAVGRSQSAASAPVVMGTVRDSAGKPLNGAAVSARASDQTLTTSVYTDDRGVYVFPRLVAGKYRLWAQAVGFTTQKTELALDGSHTVVRDLTLNPLADFEAQLTGYEWFNSLPDDSVNHRRLKQVMFVACTGCHSLDLVLQNKFDETGWNAIVKSMETGTYNGWRGTEDIPADQLGWQGQIIRYHRDELAKYLAEVRGPNSAPLVFKPLDRPAGDAARVVVTEYDMPIAERGNEMPWYNGADWMLGPSTGMHGMVGVHDVLLDAAGTAWISQSRTTFETNRTLVKLDPKTGSMKAIHLAGADGKIIFVEQMGPDQAGNLWMHSTDSLIRLNTSNETFTLFPMPVVMGGMANSTDADSKGRVFVNGRFGVAEFDPAEQSKTGVAYPGWHLYQQQTPGNGTTYGVTVDRDDNVWWSESYADKVARRDMKTGKVTEFDMRDPGYAARKALATPADLAFYDSIGAESWAGNSAEPLPYANMPRRLSADKNGNTVWVPNWADSNLAEIDIHTLKVTYHPLPIHVHPYKTTVDKNHNVWTDTSLADAVFRFTPATQTWTMFRLPSHGCGSRHVSFDDVRGDLWLPCDQADKVARFQFRTAAGIRALEAAATH